MHFTTRSTTQHQNEELQQFTRLDSTKLGLGATINIFSIFQNPSADNSCIGPTLGPGNACPQKDFHYSQMAHYLVGAQKCKKTISKFSNLT